MTQITLGRFNAYNTTHGCYDAYFQYDTATRDGTTITLTNCKVYYVRVGTGWTTNRIATTGSIGGGQNAWSNVTLNPSGTESPATMTHTLGTKTITGVDYAVSTISVNVQAKGTGASSTWTATSGTVQLNATINVTVPTILISEVTTTNANIGSASSININRYSSAFTHKLYYKFTGQASYTLIASGVTTSYGWTVPTSAYALIPNALTIGCTIKCETYNGASYIGESTTTMTASVDQNTNKPDVSGAITDTNAVSTALTGDNSKIVKYISNARTVITSTAKNSATISSVKVTCADGKSSTLATSTLNSVESGTFTVEATDSRGIKNSVVYNKTLINYIKLTLNVNVYRTQPTNNEIACTFNGNYFNGSFGAENNTLNVKWRYREVGGSYGSYSNFTETIVGNTYSNGASEIVLGTSFDYTKSYQFEFIANDQIYTASEIISTKTVTQGLPNYHWDADSFTHETDVYYKNQLIKPTKEYHLSTVGLSDTLWYPISFRTFDGSYNNTQNNYGRVQNFEISTFSGSGSALAYNSNTLKGFARGGGYSDLRAMFDISITRFSETENVFYGIYQGTTNFGDIVIYVRGDNNYIIKSDSNFVELHTSNLTMGDSVFQAGVSTPAGTNIVVLLNLTDKYSGRYSGFADSSYEKSFITTYPTANLTLGTSGEIPFNTILTENGNKLTLQSNRVYINSRGAYEISANVWVNETTRVYFRLRHKNSGGTTVASFDTISPDSISSSSPYWTGSVASVIVIANPGDYIVVEYINNVTGAILNSGSGTNTVTNMTVKEV